MDIKIVVSEFFQKALCVHQTDTNVLTQIKKYRVSHQNLLLLILLFFTERKSYWSVRLFPRDCKGYIDFFISF